MRYSSNKLTSHIIAGPADYQRTLWRGGPASLANRFRCVTKDVIGFVKALTNDQWQTVDAPDGLSIGAMVHHLAEGDRLTRSVLQPMLRGAERPPSDTELETRDRELLQAKEAADFAHLSRAATVQMLRRQSAEVSRTLREVSATDLDQVYTLWGETVLLREFIQRWIEDIGQHLAEMRSTLRTIPD